MAKKKKNKIGVMYSTNSNFEYEYESEEETLAIENQRLEVWIDKKIEAVKSPLSSKVL